MGSISVWPFGDALEESSPRRRHVEKCSCVETNSCSRFKASYDVGALGCVIPTCYERPVNE